jgi:hypothetical protein
MARRLVERLPGVGALICVFVLAGLRLWESQRLQTVQPLTVERMRRYVMSERR